MSHYRQLSDLKSEYLEQPTILLCLQVDAIMLALRGHNRKLLYQREHI